jgi:hypothetical protein
MNNETGTTTPHVLRYDPAFIPGIQKYITTTVKSGGKPTIIGFAESIETTKETVIAWATKKLKDKDGKETKEYARPEFLAEIRKLDHIEKGKENPPVHPEEPKTEKKKKEKLEPKRELFCQLYVSPGEFFGNGVQSYIEAYGPDQHKSNWYKSACASASEILSNPKVFNRINELLEDMGMNDANADKQLSFLMNQHADFSSKLGAVKEYNKLKKRITDKMDVTSGGKPVSVSTIDYNEIAKRVSKHG